MELKKGSKINFRKSDTIKDENANIVFYKKIKKKSTIIIENEYGWIPENEDLEKYGLDKSKKYLFISENEILKDEK